MNQETPVTPPNPKLQEVLAKLTALEQDLLTNDPLMPTHLKEIHKYLIQFEELSHLLTEEQIAIILEGQQKQLGLMLAAETTKSKTKAGGKSLKGVTADDL